MAFTPFMQRDAASAQIPTAGLGLPSSFTPYLPATVPDPRPAITQAGQQGLDSWNDLQNKIHKTENDAKPWLVGGAGLLGAGALASLFL